MHIEDFRMQQCQLALALAFMFDVRAGSVLEAALLSQSRRSCQALYSNRVAIL
jgi:hypothetical protein